MLSVQMGIKHTWRLDSWGNLTQGMSRNIPEEIVRFHGKVQKSELQLHMRKELDTIQSRQTFGNPYQKWYISWNVQSCENGSILQDSLASRYKTQIELDSGHARTLQTTSFVISKLCIRTYTTSCSHSIYPRPDPFDNI